MRVSSCLYRLSQVNCRLARTQTGTATLLFCAYYCPHKHSAVSAVRLSALPTVPHIYMKISHTHTHTHTRTHARTHALTHTYEASSNRIPHMTLTIYLSFSAIIVFALHIFHGSHISRYTTINQKKPRLHPAIPKTGSTGIHLPTPKNFRSV